jgi:hypothetical protein
MTAPGQKSCHDASDRPGTDNGKGLGIKLCFVIHADLPVLGITNDKSTLQGGQVSMKNDRTE